MDLLCTDWQIYSEIFHSLFNNSIKHSPPKTRIKVRVIFEGLETFKNISKQDLHSLRHQKHCYLTGFLRTFISDQGFGMKQLTPRRSLSSISVHSNNTYNESDRKDSTAGLKIGTNTAKGLS